MTDIPDRIDRRTAIRAAGGFVGATALPTLSGCLGGNGGDGSDDPDEDPPPDDGADVDYDVETVAEGFENPWGLAFLPDDGRLLVTERPGRLSLLDPADGTVEAVAGAPEVFAEGQGGLLDVAVHPDYPDDPRVYLTYSASAADSPAGDGASGATTHVGAGRLALDGDGGTPALDGFEALFVAEPFRDTNLHFGSRATFGPDGALFVTVGDRRDTDFGPDHVSQDRSNDLGATLRLTPDGDAHPDNPFVDDPDAADAIYSYGHRNPQAMAVRRETNALWQCEHGEEDGDEINAIERAGNYGWPIASEACRYGTDDPVAPGHDERDDVIAPVHYWPCGSGGFPPSGAVFYDGDAFPKWRGDLFAGTLAARYLGRFTVDGDGRDATVTERDPLLDDREWRMRAVAVEPSSGHIYVAVDAGDAPVARIVPA
ncbi:glucose sorbosone dehydrogenase [Halorubrum distributum JCM 9100]|uniref:Glucose sorbosone dehydrogenase n=2 Tax=Halorubrum distributum TaxID=29283 RepID=M0ENG5_9EURY|nr:PQQ-dependent sugar dehydrogenase [Halorubrum distributum]ELZ49326.1 glucose sorbosone dehydrogenase [Halorubrum distributum JCM 9100]ELZ57790.1 glucose sorbosone dehydrogenase [Halorubrum distributum JCM 10118]